MKALFHYSRTSRVKITKKKINLTVQKRNMTLMPTPSNYQNYRLLCNVSVNNRNLNYKFKKYIVLPAYPSSARCIKYAELNANAKDELHLKFKLYVFIVCLKCFFSFQRRQGTFLTGALF